MDGGPAQDYFSMLKHLEIIQLNRGHMIFDMHGKHMNKTWSRTIRDVWRKALQMDSYVTNCDDAKFACVIFIEMIQQYD